MAVVFLQNVPPSENKLLLLLIIHVNLLYKISPNC